MQTLSLDPGQQQIGFRSFFRISFIDFVAAGDLHRNVCSRSREKGEPANSGVAVDYLKALHYAVTDMTPMFTTLPALNPCPDNQVVQGVANDCVLSLSTAGLP